jgi:hypothetical protein
VTLRELLTHLDISFKETGESPLVTAGWIGTVCPWCGKGTGKPGLGIHVQTLKLSCWKCGSHDLAGFLQESTNLPWGQIKLILRNLDAIGGVPAPEKSSGRYREPLGVGELLPAHRNYLIKRGFDPDEIGEVWGVRGIGVGGNYQWRLFLPVSDGKKPVSWTTRAVGNVELRYISAPPTDETVPLKSTLYGRHLARNAVVVVEGPTDAWRIGPGAVATYGLSHTPAQVALIATYPVRAICFDTEPTAQRRARKLADDLATFPGVTYVVTLGGPDPDTSPRAELDELRRTFLE